ncbi:MAG: heme exporter protein CcmB [Candidatus Acidiferrales bacterium]
MNTFEAAAVIFAKEIRAEWRTKELLNSTFVFALIIVVLFSFAFDFTASEARLFGPGLLWIAFLFGGSLMLHPSFGREHANDTLDALRMAPIEPFAIVLGKTLANLTFLFLVEIILLPVFSVLYNVSLVAVLGRLLLVLALGTFGLAVTGTVFSAIAAQARLRELLLPLLLFPILAPVVIASVECTVSLMAEDSALPASWTEVLVIFDAVFLAATWLLADQLLEE